MRDRVVTILRESARSHSRWRAVAVVITLAAAGCQRAAQNPVTAYTEEIALHGNESPELRRQLAAGTWLIEIRERGIDLRAAIEWPGRGAVQRGAHELAVTTQNARALE